MNRDEALLAFRLTLAYVLVCTVAIVILLVGGIVLMERELRDIETQIDRIDAQMAPEPTPTGRVG